jgi:3-oxoacyl-[acyl-carrier-protein] synthase-3
VRFQGSVWIRGWALHLPDQVETAAEAIAADRAEPDVTEVHGFVSVHIAKSAAAELAVEAALRAIEVAAVPAADIRLVAHSYIHHQGQDFWSAAHYVAQHSGAVHAEAYGIQQLCHGSVAALSTAAYRMVADPGAGRALVTSADRFPEPIPRWRGDTTTVVGDGATALVLDPHEGELELLSLCVASAPALEEMHRAGLPFSDFPFESGDHMSTHKAKTRWLEREGPMAFARISLASLLKVVRGAVSEADLILDDPRLTVVTLPRLSRKLLDSAYAPILAKLPNARYVPMGSDTGHLGSGDFAANVAELMDGGHLPPGGHAVLVNAGAGFTWSCAAF